MAGFREYRNKPPGFTNAGNISPVVKL